MAETIQKIGVVDDPDFENSSANIKARKDVVTRIKQMPRLTDEQRAKLMGAVGRARNMAAFSSSRSRAASG